MGLLDTVLFAWADGGEFHRSFVHKGFVYHSLLVCGTS